MATDCANPLSTVSDILQKHSINSLMQQDVFNKNTATDNPGTYIYNTITIFQLESSLHARVLCQDLLLM